MGPVWQNPIQRTVRTAHLSVLMTVHNFHYTIHNTAQNSSDNLHYLQTTITTQMLSIGEGAIQQENFYTVSLTSQHVISCFCEVAPTWQINCLMPISKFTTTVLIILQTIITVRAQTLSTGGRGTTSAAAAIISCGKYDAFSFNSRRQDSSLWSTNWITVTLCCMEWQMWCVAYSRFRTLLRDLHLACGIATIFRRPCDNSIGYRVTARSIQDCCPHLPVSDRPSTIVPGRWLPARLWCPSAPPPIIRFTDVCCTTHPQHLRRSMLCCCRTAGLELFASWIATMLLTRTI